MARGAYNVSPDSENPRDIIFAIANGFVGEVPEDQLSLQNEVADALTVLRGVFPNEGQRFEEYFRQLLSLAQAGLVGETANPQVASRALATLKGDIVAREGGRIKNQYMKKLGAKAALLGVPTLVGAILVILFLPAATRLAGYMFLWVGAMVGVWLSFGTRKVALRFEDLHIPEQDRLEPMVRLIFSGLLSLIMGLIFANGAMEVSLGSITTAQFVEDPEIAILIGVLCGFSEKALSAQIASSAVKIIPARAPEQ